MKSNNKFPLLWLENVSKGEMPKDYFVLRSPGSIRIKTIRIGISKEEGNVQLSVLIRVRRKGSLLPTLYKIEFGH